MTPCSESEVPSAELCACEAPSFCFFITCPFFTEHTGMVKRATLAVWDPQCLPDIRSQGWSDPSFPTSSSFLVICYQRPCSQPGGRREWKATQR
jgi:hypothetical protein